MGTIKLGDRLIIPGKNVKGEVAFIGETHFSDGIWFGIILDDPVGKHNGTVENKRYFKCPKNHGMFIKATYFEKECVDINSIIEKPCSFIPKRIKHPNNQKHDTKQKTEITFGTSKSTINHKKETQSGNKSAHNLSGDNETNNNDENMKLPKLTECGDNNNASDEKKFQYIRRYPNYLKASSKISGSHFCLNRTKGNKTDQDTDASDRVTHDNGKNLILPTSDSRDNPDKDDNECRKRFIYPNYLKASSKLVRKHFCVTKNTDTIDDAVKDSVPEKNMEMQTLKRSTDNIDNSQNSFAYLIKYPYHQKPSNFKENLPCLTKSVEINKVNYIQDICSKDTELEALRRENEELKNKLKNAEVCLQEALNKCNEVKEENKHLKYDNECQRKQIKFQKSHLKLLKMGQGNYHRKTETYGIRRNKYKQKKLGDFLESNLHGIGDENTSDRKFDLEDKATISKQRVVELEEQNKLMIYGLLELRDFLKKQTESQPVESEALNFDSYSRFQNRNNKKSTFSESFSRTSVLNTEAYTSEDPTPQSREYSEMLREMTKFNELMKEKRKYVKDWEANLDVDSYENTDSTKIHDSDNIDNVSIKGLQNSLSPSTYNNSTEFYADISKDKMDSEIFQNSTTPKKNYVQGMYNNEINQSPYFQGKKTKMDEKYPNYNPGDGISFDQADCIDETHYGVFAKDPIFDEGSLHSNTTLIEQYIFEKQDSENDEKDTSRKSDMNPDFPTDILSHSTDMGFKSSGSYSMRSKWDRFEKKMLPVSTKLRPDEGMETMNK